MAISSKDSDLWVAPEIADASSEKRTTAFGSASTPSLLRFLTCGSVDDGKSTLIGRLLVDSGTLFSDQSAALATDSSGFGSQSDLDYSLLLDGLEAEREQGITIDVAYRYFSSPRRSFIVADTPGHEQYTRNMVTGASTSDAAVLLIDARRGLLAQTKRHAYIASMLGISSIAIAVNKMDLVDYNERTFRKVSDAFTEFAKQLEFVSVQCIPVSALKGDNVTMASSEMKWYEGPTLLRWLERAATKRTLSHEAFRMPVQMVNRPNESFRGYSGTISSGLVASGDQLVVLPRCQRVSVDRIVTFEGDRAESRRGDSVTLTFNESVDVERGDVLVHTSHPLFVGDRFEAQLVWMTDTPLVLNARHYLLKLATRTVPVLIESLSNRLDIQTLDNVVASGPATLGLNDIGTARLRVDIAIAFDRYASSRELGGFILIDRSTCETVAAGMIRHPLNTGGDVGLSEGEVDRLARSLINGHKPAVIWLTGLSGAGKSTLAGAVETLLHRLGMRTYILDGDNLRTGLNRDLGFTDLDRVENIRRISEVARLMTDAGLVVLVAAISPFRVDREMARERVGYVDFIEVFVDVPLSVAEFRDPKGLYAKARNGEIPNFTGIGSPYERPANPDLRLDTSELSVQEASAAIVRHLRSCGIFDAPS